MSKDSFSFLRSGAGIEVEQELARSNIRDEMIRFFI